MIDKVYVYEFNTKQRQLFGKSGARGGKLQPIRSQVSLVVTLIAAVLIVMGVIAGLIPRWRQQTELNAETRELSVLHRLGGLAQTGPKEL